MPHPVTAGSRVYLRKGSQCVKSRDRVREAGGCKVRPRGQWEEPDRFSDKDLYPTCH